MKKSYLKILKIVAIAAFILLTIFLSIKNIHTVKKTQLETEESNGIITIENKQDAETKENINLDTPQKENLKNLKLIIDLNNLILFRIFV